MPGRDRPADRVTAAEGRRRRGGIWSATWWRDALERAAGAAASAVLGGVGTEQLELLQLASLRAAGALALGGALVSLVLSVAASGKGDHETASFRH
ncbi:holin [Nonomuraea sp. NPDC050790]|uniref:holin n=1 Tax=Nonomuraea sp. NPDC050790 TaxID=3364371 RepID=UPI00379EC515